MRLPDWLYTRVQHVYLTEKHARDREAHERAEADDRALRAWADRMRDAHNMGTCGGAVNRCPFVPCVPLV
jgi:hypothetical protein